MPRTIMTRTRTFAVALLLALGAGVLLASPAAAHTRLISSNPAKNAKVAPPSEVLLVFSDRIQHAKVLVKDTAGKEFQTGEARRDGPRVTQSLSGALPAGSYTVAYRVVGEDGHPIPGTLDFTVTGGDTPTSDAGATPAPGTTPTLPPGAEPAGAPASPAGAQKADDGGSNTPLVIGGGLLLGVGIGFAWVVLRRRDPAGNSGE
ncbi:copper resistance protein CopC [Actinomadura craniellae]|uniref:Copper resistance protein CopC n=1 Tax=Actinomadura craniellae TaxID=2231787 RepID=A0A365H2E5_9ACTN|nr:copper resistance CopC family protein [Actinomadura craniellae]RAY13196.1 copper resistance protein CopC [Actinomadura craniellae]